MKTVFRFLILVTLLAMLAGATLPASAAQRVRFKLLDRLPTHLAVGETYIIRVRVNCSEPFLFAMAMSDEYYPGRGIFFNGIDRATHGNEAILQLEITGKESTADLWAVQDWPTTEDWPAGVAPAAIVVGVRYAGGEVVSQIFPFAVAVP